VRSGNKTEYDPGHMETAGAALAIKMGSLACPARRPFTFVSVHWKSD
jgi:hypothetical protein